jgi:hypothetical protein
MDINLYYKGPENHPINDYGVFFKLDRTTCIEQMDGRVRLNPSVLACLLKLMLKVVVVAERISFSHP